MEIVRCTVRRITRMIRCTRGCFHLKHFQRQQQSAKADDDDDNSASGSDDDDDDEDEGAVMNESACGAAASEFRVPSTPEPKPKMTGAVSGAKAAPSASGDAPESSKTTAKSRIFGKVSSLWSKSK